MVIISGKNGAGKTSAIDSIWATIQWRAGKKLNPSPIRKGAKFAEVTVTFEELVITRRWLDSGNTSLRVTNREGWKVPDSPQELLDKFIGVLSFDPSIFSQMKSPDQRQLLLKLVKVDIDSFDVKIEGLREKRRLQGQTVKLYEGERDTTDFSGIPSGEIDISELQRDVEKAIDHNRDVDEAGHKIGYCQEEIRKSAERILELEDKVKELRKGISTYKNMIDREERFTKDNKKTDVEVVRAKLNKALEINELVQARQRNLETDKKWRNAKDVYNTYTSDIETIEYNKEKALKEAQMPIKGLSVDDTGVIYNSIPFTQLAISEQIKVSFSIAMALNPKMQVVFLRNYTLLDVNSKKVVKDLSKKYGFQVWAEQVDSSGKIGFYIEEGEVKNG